MKVLHTGLAASSEDKADRFYGDLLGLEKAEPKTLAREIGQALFGIDQDLVMLNYKGEETHFEIFAVPGYEASQGQVAHACLQVADLQGFVDRCKTAGAKVIEVPKGPKVITFVADFDGNLFEVKQ